jgi:intracellular septation protein A
MKQYWSILWRFYLCTFLVSRVHETFFYVADERFHKFNLTMVLISHGAFFLAAYAIRKHKFSQGFWRDLYDANQLKVIYSTFILGAIVMSGLSFLVATNLATDVWVDFRLFGIFLYALIIPAVAQFRVNRFHGESQVRETSI